MARILCIGDIMLDVIAFVPPALNYGEDTPSTIVTRGGGAGANVASWAKSAGAESFLIARVGDDPAGVAVIAELDALGVQHSQRAVPELSTGVVVILVDPTGERTMIPDSGANAGLTIADLPNLSDFDAAYISGYSLLNPLSRDGVLEMITEIRAKSIPIFFDPTTIGGMAHVELHTIHGWLSLMDTLLMNEEESFYLTSENEIESALASLLKFSPTAVIKRGSFGAVGKNRSGVYFSAPAKETVAIDTTGAGDSFAGGFIAQFLINQELSACIEAGLTQAALCVAIAGARPQVTTEI
ncbi:MAG: hypothetical protein F2704_01630 [Actinobacteria bacterium]|nr:hypothetical protein [Actinomycetota bacterium]MSX24566.1 hypothetical protein [Actinomycetota bacterium]MSY46851.1 hypothetical protein [Actinomycetota bacterium]MSY56951.1 hypothetical protein [Actinomycetota bacterium]